MSRFTVRFNWAILLDHLDHYNMSSFVRRYGHLIPSNPITIREDAPKELRRYVIELAYGTGLGEIELRDAICRALRVRPSAVTVWAADYQKETKELMLKCTWPKVYSAIESIYESCPRKAEFEEELNQFFIDKGLGWQLTEGLITYRGEAAFENNLLRAEVVLGTANLATATQEMREAISDLSRKPHADVTGAIQHSLACLECVAREVAGGSKLTLGELIKSRKDLVPEPLNSAIEKVWGFSSNQGRHLQEGKAPSFEDAELLVGLSAAISTYLARKFKLQPATDENEHYL